MAGEILTLAEMAAADKAAAAAGTPVEVLMERAGAAVARAVEDRFSPRPTVVWCGPGDNGGDGYVAARLLHEHGWPVRVEALGPPAGAAARAAADRWKGVTTPLRVDAALNGELFIDALFGAGLSRALEGEAAALAQKAQGLADRIVAVDLPSGLNGDSAAPVGGLSLRAALTVTFHRRKLAHALEPGRSLCGPIVVADIGLGDTPTALFENEPELWLPRYPWPGAATHKHRRGRLAVVSGDAWSTGAARLAARAGLRIGAGVVTVLSPPDALPINAAHLEAVMLKGFSDDAELAVVAETADAVVIGPAAGVTDRTARNLAALARTGATLVIDADAFSVFQSDPQALFALLERDDVLTPHAGEFERLFPGLLAAAPQRATAVRQAAAQAGAVVLLKGSDTVIAAPDGRAAINLNGSPWLATAGSGDVLAGFVAGLIAQGMGGFEAACAAVWIHAAAAEHHGPGLISEDLPDLAPKIINILSTKNLIRL